MSKSNKKRDVTTSCPVCGKPLTEVNDLGMFCEDFCEMARARAAKPVVDTMVKNVFDMFFDENGPKK